MDMNGWIINKEIKKLLTQNLIEFKFVIECLYHTMNGWILNKEISKLVTLNLIKFKIRNC